ncbi:MAG: hypothetical protein AAFR52_04450 [Pseudomonadota bacterium]
MNGLDRFGRNDAGGVSFDWVVLAAGLVVIAVGVHSMLGSGLDSVVTAAENQLSAAASGETVMIGDGVVGSGGGGEDDASSAGSTLCLSDVCYTDSDGDGFADSRSAGGADPEGVEGNQSMAGLAATGWSPAAE